jgi:pimeloyl-ACP methyl ester carboxylesterase
MRYILPGLGGTNAMYGAAWRALPDTLFPDWPRMPGEITLRTIARAVIDANGIRKSDQIGGSSLGGIVAIEIARILKSERIILIGSARERKEINHFLLNLTPLSQVTPFGFFQIVAGKTTGPLGRMFAGNASRFLREACRGLATWSGMGDLRVDVLRMHGSRDHVIRCPKEGFIIPGAGHFVAMTHAPECVEIVKSMSPEKPQ